MRTWLLLNQTFETTLLGLEKLDTDKTLILGRSGIGKTFLCRKWQTAYPRVWVIDQLREYENETNYVKNWGDFEKTFKKLKLDRPEKYRIIIQLDRNLPDKTLVLDEMLGMIYGTKDDPANCLVVIEEAHMIASIREMPRHLGECILTGRHQKLAMIFTTQRISLLNKTIGSQCAHVFCGNTFEMNDLEYLRKTFRFDPEEIQKLDPRTFVYFRPGQKNLIVKNTLTA